MGRHMHTVPSVPKVQQVFILDYTKVFKIFFICVEILNLLEGI